MSVRSPESLVDELTLEEQVSLLSGRDAWTLPPIERLGIGSLVVTDGPNGARGGGGLLGNVASAAFPVGIALGASWNPALVERIGAALAQEARDKGAHVLLGPTINLHRGPLNGRNFECLSEDPVLTAALVTRYVTGLQRHGVAATLKHFVANESEIERTTVSSNVDERTLRELYLVPFEHAVREVGAWAVMTSYNRLNGTYTSEHPWLLRRVLRGDWGFDGLVMSDWYGSHSTGPTLAAGLDLEMPGPPRDRGARLLEAVERGEVARGDVRRAALNVLRLMSRTGALDDLAPREEHASERDSTRALIREAGHEAMVLLKNTERCLPLRSDARIAVIGPNARVARTMGGGSAQLNAHRQVSPYDGLVAALGEERLAFAEGCRNHRFEPVLDGPCHVEWFDNNCFDGDPVHRETIDESQQFLFGGDASGGGRIDPTHFSLRMQTRFRAPETDRYRVGLHCTGRARVAIDGEPVLAAWDDWQRGRTFFEEGCDPVTTDIDLEAGREYVVVLEYRAAPSFNLEFAAWYLGIGRPLGQSAIDQAVEIAAAADVALLCVGRNAEWDTEGSDLSSMRLPGDQDALVSAIAEVANRTVVLLQTGGPVEMPWIDKVDAVLQGWYPGQEAGHSVADVLTGLAEPGGRLPQSFPVALGDAPTIGRGERVYPGVSGQVHYEEGLDIGYRHHLRHDVSPLFAFGHGLGYTDIAIRSVALEASSFEAEGRLWVDVELENRGARAGQAVVQVYVSPDDPPVPRPPAELVAFSKIRLEAGRSGSWRLELGPRAFAWFDTDAQRWTVSPGRYTIRTGLSSIDIADARSVSRDTELTLPA